MLARGPPNVRERRGPTGGCGAIGQADGPGYEQKLPIGYSRVTHRKKSWRTQAMLPKALRLNSH